MSSRPCTAEVKQAAKKGLVTSHPPLLLLPPCRTAAHVRHTAWSVSWHFLGSPEALAAIQHHFFISNPFHRFPREDEHCSALHQNGSEHSHSLSWVPSKLIHKILLPSFPRALQVPRGATASLVLGPPSTLVSEEHPNLSINI